MGTTRRGFVGAAIGVAAVVCLPPATGEATSRPPLELTASGEVDGLFPGAQRVMPISVTNPTSTSWSVTWFELDVDATTEACASWLSVDQSDETMPSIDPWATIVVDVEVSLDRAAPDSCQGRTFDIGVSFAAVEAAQPGDEVPSVTPLLPATGRSIILIVALGFGLCIIGGTARWATRP